MKRLITVEEARHIGRPPVLEESLVRHLKKCYSGKEFTSKEVENSFRLQLLGRNTKPNVILGMALNKLKKKSVIAVTGERDTGRRGVNNRIYKLS